MTDEYISKQRAKDLMGCCLASAKANYKAETSVFKKEQFKHYAETIEAMIDVVGSVETADVQPAKHGKWILKENAILTSECSLCKRSVSMLEAKFYKFCPYCGARMEGVKNE